MTIAEFEEYVKGFMAYTPAGFTGMTYGTAFYQPMIEVIDYLQENEFTTYIVSGSDRFICRALASEACHIPYNQVIGMDVELRSTLTGEEDALDHTFKTNEDLIRTDNVLIKNLKTNKVRQIAQEIGKTPVLSFGNSSGDSAMHNYVLGNQEYDTEAFMLIANDAARDYGDEAKGNAKGEDWKKADYHVISMKDDFKTIYGDNVKKTA